MKPTRLFILLATLLAPGLLSAQTQVPQRISYQGIVTDLANNLVGDPTPVNRTVIFRVWDNPSFAGVGGLVYSEEQVVTISKGEFSVLIGGGANVTGTPLGFSETAKGPGTVNISDVFNGSNRYLGVTVDDGSAAADPEISPRQQIVTTAFAFRAKEAETVVGGSINNAALADNSINLLKMQSASVNSNTIVDNTILGADIFDGTITADDLAGGSITASKLGADVGFWTVNGGNVYRGSGNVGIGTANPGQKLSVQTVTGAYGVTHTDGTVLIGTFVNGGGGQFGTASNHPLQFFTSGGAAQMTLGTNGNVGVGTASPGGRLTIAGVEGNSSFKDGLILTGSSTRGTGIQLENNSAGGRDYALFTSGSGNGPGAGSFSLLDLTNDDYRMVVSPTGNVGIGMTNPGFPLNMDPSFGTKISLNGNAEGGSFGFGIQASRLQVHAGTGADISLGNGPSATMAEAMRIKGDGKVGIGTSSPSEKLEVGGNVRIQNGALQMFNGNGGFGTVAMNTALVRNEINSLLSPGSDGGHLRLSAGGGTGVNNKTAIDLYGYNTNDMRFFTNGTERMRVASGGNVGIGVTNPGVRGKLEVGGSAGSFFLAAYGFLDVGGYGIVANTNENANLSSIFATGRITANNYIAFSDERIKRVEGRSDPAGDLATLQGIEITDYTYIDQVSKGSAKHKKVIAQQVEEVFPQAVSRSTGEVPDIFKRASINDGWVTLVTDLKKGEMVRLIGEKEEGIHQVLEVTDGKFRTDFKPEGDEVFVYGRQVKDFLSVDYEAIAMLNVSATQQIKKEKDLEVAALQKENTELRARLEALEAKDAARDAVLASIEKRLSASEGDVQPVSLKSTAAAK